MQLNERLAHAQERASLQANDPRVSIELPHRADAILKGADTDPSNSALHAVQIGRQDGEAWIACTDGRVLLVHRWKSAGPDLDPVLVDRKAWRTAARCTRGETIRVGLFTEEGISAAAFSKRGPDGVSAVVHQGVTNGSFPNWRELEERYTTEDPVLEVRLNPQLLARISDAIHALQDSVGGSGMANVVLKLRTDCSPAQLEAEGDGKNSLGRTVALIQPLTG